MSTQASFVQVVWLRLVRCSAADVLHSFSYVFCWFFFSLKKRLLDQVSDIEKTWQDYRKVARLGVFVYLKKESCTFQLSVVDIFL